MTAPARPDLSALLESDPETVAHILCAECGGATWTDEGRMSLLMDTGNDPLVVRRGANWSVRDRLPRPLHDDGAAWCLMVRERIDVAHDEDTGAVTALSWNEDGPGFGVIAKVTLADSRRAVVLAALHEHAHDPRWAEMIPTLIERLGRPAAERQPEVSPC